MNRLDLQNLADLRIEEAECLFRNGFFDGAYDLAGHAVEAGLKACIARTVNQHDFPPNHTNRDCYTHDFDILSKTAGLDGVFKKERQVRPHLASNRDLVKIWRVDSRYDVKGTRTDDLALDLIEETTDGVLAWIKQHW